jgi:hypothetical protein
VKFLLNQVSLPEGKFETLGIGDKDDDVDLWLSDVQKTFGANSIVLGEVSRKKSFADGQINRSPTSASRRKLFSIARKFGLILARNALCSLPRVPRTF